jgi:hydroxyacylglutathione hydrolase
VYDERLAQAAYLIGCQRTGEAIVVDPERDVDRYIELAEANDLRIVAVAETHIHADFVSGARELAERIRATVYLSDEGDADWKYQWLDSRVGGGGYEHQLLKDGDRFSVGNIEFEAMHTPGHTPEHLCYLVTDHGGGAGEPMGLLSGDFVFVGDLGRPDLLETAAGEVGNMEPSAKRLFASVKRLGGLPDYLQVWPAHGAGSACGKALGAVPTSTIGYERRFSPAIQAAKDEQRFVDFILSGQPEPPLYFKTMKRVNKVGPMVLGSLPSPRKMYAAELRELDGRRVAIIDTRGWDAFRSGHVPGSLSLPLIDSFPTDAGSLVRDDEEIYLIIDGGRLEEAVRALVRIGLDRIGGWFEPIEVERSAESGHELAKVPQVSAGEAADLVARDEVSVLDVRRRTEYDEDHVPGATNIAHTRLMERLDETPKDKPLLVHCRLGVRSARASAFLKRAGYDVVNLEGGFVAWQKANPRMTASGFKEAAV